MVKVGGIVVYSTCSLNPVENEAVVAETMRRVNASGKRLELLDVHNRFEGLKMRKGMTDWEVVMRKMKRKEEEKESLLGKKDDTQALGEPNNLQTLKTDSTPKEKFALPTDPEARMTIALKRYLYVNGDCDEKDFGVENPKKYFDIYPSYHDYLKAHQGEGINHKIKPNLFPGDQEELRTQIGIEKTGRIMPHDQDTGGFYLAVFKKLDNLVFERDHEAKNLSVELSMEREKLLAGVLNESGEPLKIVEEKKEVSEKKIEEIKDIKKSDSLQIKKEKSEEIKETKTQNGSNNQTEKKPKKTKYGLRTKDLMSVKPVEEEDWQSIMKEYGLSPDFPKHLLINSSDKRARRVNLINQGLYDMLTPLANKSLRKIYFGVSVFARNNRGGGKDDKMFRLSYSGVALIYPYLASRCVINLNFEEFRFVLSQYYSISRETLKEVPSLYEKIDKAELGSYCVKMETDLGEGKGVGIEFLVFQVMKGSIAVMVAKEQLQALRVKYEIPEPDVEQEKKK